MRRAVVLAICAVVAVTSCARTSNRDSRTAKSQPGDTASASTPVAPPPAARDERPASVLNASPGAGTAARGPTKSPGTSYPDLEPGQSAKLWGDTRLEVELDHVCATTGTLMKATIRTVPGGLVGAAVRYKDGKPHEDFTWGRAETGEFVWAWTVKPTVPRGKADAMVTVGKSGETGAGAMATFAVADKC